MNKYFVSAATAIGLFSAMPATAAYVVDTGAGSGQGFAISNEQTLAGLFTLTAATNITSIEGRFFGNESAGFGTISIYNGSSVPTAANLLFSAGFTIVGQQIDSWQGVPVQNLNLAAGDYWVRFSSVPTIGLTALRGGSPNPLANYAFSSNGLQWAETPRLELGIRIGGTPGSATGGVPEPATWAMMIFGFGAIGGALRGRRRIAIAYA